MKARDAIQEKPGPALVDASPFGTIQSDAGLPDFLGSRVGQGHRRHLDAGTGDLRERNGAVGRFGLDDRGT